LKEEKRCKPKGYKIYSKNNIRKIFKSRERDANLGIGPSRKPKRHD
jgi:hypothetical protein